MKKKEFELEVEELLDAEDFNADAGTVMGPSQIDMITSRRQALGMEELKAMGLKAEKEDGLRRDKPPHIEKRKHQSAEVHLDSLIKFLQLMHKAGVHHMQIAVEEDKPAQFACKVSLSEHEDHTHTINYWISPRTNKEPLIYYSEEKKEGT